MRKVFLDDLPRWNKGGNNRQIKWQETIGYIVKFIYDGIEGYIEILNNNNGLLELKYNEEIYHMHYCSLNNCKLGKLVNNVETLSKTQYLEYISEYKRIHKIPIGQKEIRKVFLEILPCHDIGKYMCKIDWRNCEGYNVHFIFDDIEGDIEILECDFEKRTLLCRHLNKTNEIKISSFMQASILKLISQGENKKHKNKLLEYLVNKDDITALVTKKVWMKCPDCGYKRKISINQFLNAGFSCRKCGDFQSYPEKCMFNVLEQLGLEFETEYSPSWIGQKRYDFYFEYNNEQYICEVNGNQHYKESGRKDSRSLKEEQENDILKKELALKNGIKKENYIIIDCRESNLEWIINNDNGILNSRLNELFDLSKIDWIKCEEFALSNRVKEACKYWDDNMYNVKEISDIMKKCKKTIRRYLKKGSVLGWCKYDPMQEMKHGSKNGSQSSCKKIICLNNKKVFYSISDASREYNISVSNIVQCCKNNKKTNYIYSDIVNENLTFSYHDEYIEMTDIEIEDKLKYIDNKKNRAGVKASVICLNTLEIFNSVTEASNKYIHNKNKGSGIIRVCKGENKTCGKHPITGEKLSWMYYNEYLKLKDNNITQCKIEKIYCITTNEIFNTLDDASQSSNIKYKYDINKCCKGKIKYCGRLEDGTPLEWIYYKDYIKQQQLIHNENLGQAI